MLEHLTYVIIHVRRPHKHGASIVGPLDFRRCGTVIRDERSVVHIELFVNEYRVHHPIPGFVRPVGVCLIVRVPGQSSS